MFMKTSTFVTLFLNLFVLWIDLANLKPITDLDDFPEGCAHEEQISNLVRVARSIPDDMDDVNPTYLEAVADPQQHQEELSDQKDNDISSFALSGHVSEFFRSHKSKDNQKFPQQASEERQENNLNLNKDEEFVSREALSSDEQIECYKEQNIEPPRPMLKLKDQRPFTNVFQNKQKIMSRPLIYKEKGMKRLHDKGDDSFEITSLYSEPEKKKKLKKQKVANTQSKDFNSIDQLSQLSVFKPVGVKPEFPMYDEDIDFHPDPLQGILEDKYWLDPQEQEAVIRKYVDLASHIQPPRVEYDKRDTRRIDYEPKSVDSKDAFRDAETVDRECPCREIAACGDCSRGKWKKKSNYTERERDDSFYGNYGGRKLLSLSYDDISMNDKDDRFGTGINDVNVKSDENRNILKDKQENVSKDFSHKLGSSGVLDGNIEEENQIEGDVPSFTSNYFGRKLLSFDDDENTEDEYGEDKDSKDSELEETGDLEIKNDHLLDNKRESDADYENEGEKSDNKRSLTTQRDVSANDIGSYDILKPINSSVYQYHLETENIGDENNYLRSNYTDLLQLQNPFLNKPHSFSKYYAPNKFGNLFQKTLMKHKPKEASSTIDPDLEFAVERNETFLNVSILMEDINVSVTTEMANLVKQNKRRAQPLFFGGKGRRSYEVASEKRQHFKKLQGEDLGNAQSGNSTLNGSSSMNAKMSSTIATNGTDNATTIISNTTGSTGDTTTDTAITTNTTENGTTIIAENVTTTAKPKKKIEDYDEDTFDAEIANDIVETVIAESQSGSVVGHNLGLCRRNETLSKYAKVSPESEQLLKKVTECILDRIRDRLEGQSCTLLDDELLQFLKWMVLSGESYKDYLARIKPELREFKSEVHEESSGPAPPPKPQAQSLTSEIPK